MEQTKSTGRSTTEISCRVEGFPKFNSRIADSICQGIRNGYTRKIVSNRLGIHEDTLRNWLAVGRRPDAHPLMKRFSSDFDSAYEEATTTLIDCVKFHAQDDWKAAAWLLERTRDEFRRNPRMDRVKDDLDRLSIERAEAEVRLTDAKVLALQKTVLDPMEILPVLNAVLGPPKEEE